MPEPQIQYELSDGVATVTLNRPEAMNAFGGAMREDLLARLEAAGADNAVRCIVITGAGKAFCAGGDIPSMIGLQEKGDTSVVRRRMDVGGRIVKLITAMPKPVIAAVNGAAAGAGMNIALACDMRLAAESARFAESFVKIGLVPDWGGTYLLTRLVGTAKAMELMMTGDRISASEALRLGIVNRVIPDATFRADVMAFAKGLARGPAGTLARIKQAVHIGATRDLDAALACEEKAQAEIFLSQDTREGMRAFVEKRTPKFI
jgi:2-(1,2-epoxy-1,2-dihydrophenyl)acetyl-CoA isomerase